MDGRTHVRKAFYNLPTMAFDHGQEIMNVSHSVYPSIWAVQGVWWTIGQFIRICTHVLNVIEHAADFVYTVNDLFSAQCAKQSLFLFNI